MSNNTNLGNITTLRQHLFNALEDLSNKKIDVEHAKAVGSLGQVLINSAKVEVEYLQATGQNLGTGFISNQQEQVDNKQSETATIDKTVNNLPPSPIGAVTKHICK